MNPACPVKFSIERSGANLTGVNPACPVKFFAENSEAYLTGVYPVKYLPNEMFAPLNISRLWSVADLTGAEPISSGFRRYGAQRI